MAERQVRTLLDGGSFFEGPRWHEGRWWVSDFYRHRVVAVDPGGREEAVMTVEGQDGRTLLMCAAPDFFAEARSAANEAVLLTTTVDVPRAGLP